MISILFRRASLAAVMLALSCLHTIARGQANHQSTPIYTQQRGSVHVALSDLSVIDNASSSIEVSEAESQSPPNDSIEYPDCVSKDPGRPHKPYWIKPGDFNAVTNHCVDPRYCQAECFRAGWPHDVRRLSGCAINPHYYAWYVGGGSGLPFLSSRSRTSQEGTWGLDYSLWKNPRTIFMPWTCNRPQGHTGAYATDR